MGELICMKTHRFWSIFRSTCLWFIPPPQGPQGVKTNTDEVWTTGNIVVMSWWLASTRYERLQEELSGISMRPILSSKTLTNQTAWGSKKDVCRTNTGVVANQYMMTLPRYPVKSRCFPLLMDNQWAQRFPASCAGEPWGVPPTAPTVELGDISMEYRTGSQEGATYKSSWGRRES